MRVRVGIDGTGRLGRAVLRAAVDRAADADLRAAPWEVVAVRGPAPAAVFAHLLRHDSVHGTWERPVEAAGDYLAIGDRQIRVVPAEDTLPCWAATGAEIVIDAGGRGAVPGTAQRVRAHRAGGATAVVVAGAGGPDHPTLVRGLGEDEPDPARFPALATGSATGQCAAILAGVLHRAFGVEDGVIVAVRGDAADPAGPGPDPDLRLARSSALNLVPVGCHADLAVAAVLPALAGRLAALGLRAPVVDASLVTLTAHLAEPVTTGQVRRAFAAAAAGSLRGVLHCTDEPMVSRDAVGATASCLLDTGLVRVAGRSVTVTAWYDEITGLAARALDLTGLLARSYVNPG